MDIEYLLFLQKFRESTHNFFSPFLGWVSDFAISFWPIAIICMIYWVFDRKAGKRILFGLGLGFLANGFIKLFFRVPRPWVRDARVQPYGDNKITTTGFSFPSGHSTWAAATFGGTSWWMRKKSKIVSILFLCMMFLTMFSRNYLGVHTPQDVIVGMSVTLIVLCLAHKIEDWTDKDIKRDIIVMVVGLLICVVAVCYYQTINVKTVYDAAGNVIVDPIKMKADSFEGIGFISAFVVCRYFERRYFDFDSKLAIKDRFIIGVFALIPLCLWKDNVMTIFEAHRSIGRFTTQAGIVVYTLIVVPFIMKKIKLPRWMKEENEKNN